MCQRDLVILTRDSKIHLHRAEISAVMENSGCMLALSSSEATTVWGQLEIVMSQWRRIEELAELPGPYVYTVTRTSMSKLA